MDIVPDSMTRSADDSCYQDAFGAISNGDTVITHTDERIGDFDASGSTNVNAISVWAFFRGCNFDIIDMDSFAVCYMHIEGLAIHQINLANESVGDPN